VKSLSAGNFESLMVFEIWNVRAPFIYLLAPWKEFAPQIRATKKI
jgi:hypothetical protein